MSKLYGSVVNRIFEGRILNEDKLVHTGDDINMYYWSDVHCYYVTAVENQKRIRVKEYNVCADKSKQNGMGHQNWLYFKTLKEMNEYLNKYHPGKYPTNVEDNSEETWVFRYGGWWKETAKGKYAKLDGKITVGKNIKNYYYDWSF